MEYIEWDLVNPVTEYDYRDTDDEDTGLHNPYMPSTHLPPVRISPAHCLTLSFREPSGVQLPPRVRIQKPWYRMAGTPPPIKHLMVQ